LSCHALSEIIAFVADRDILESIEEEVRLSRELHAETLTVIERTREHNDKVLAAYREFTREAIARVQRIGREEIRELRRFGDEMQRFGEDQRRLGEEQREARTDIRDLREESRAQRQALLRMIDRLGPGGSTA